MINKLTKEQEADLPVFAENWIKKVISPASDDDIRASINSMYKNMGEKTPRIIILDGPFFVFCIIKLLCANLDANLDANLRANLRDNLRDNLDANLDANLRDNLDANLDANLRVNLDDNLRANLDANLDDNLDANLDANLRANLRDNLHANLDANLRVNLDDNLRANLHANLCDNLHANLHANLRDKFNGCLLNWYVPIWWSCWAGYYKFAEKIGVKFNEEKLKIFTDFVTSVSVLWPFKGLVFVCRKPLISKKGINLHNEKGPALLFKDGWADWYLNGIKVPRWLVEISPDDLTIEKLLSIKNADVRRECLRKMGVDRLISHGKEIDTQGGYKLIDLGKFFVDRGNFYAPYLVMKNPSVDVWHCEGVHEDCRTVRQALTWRNGTNRVPVKLT